MNKKKYTKKDIYKIYPKCTGCNQENYLTSSFKGTCFCCMTCAYAKTDFFYFSYISNSDGYKDLKFKINKEYSFQITSESFISEKIKISIYENKYPNPHEIASVLLDKEFYIPTHEELLKIVENLIFA